MLTMHAPRNGSRRCGRRLTALAARWSISAALLLAALAVLLALPAQAQTATTLVSNTGQSFNTNASSLWLVGVSGALQFTQAQQFTTGDNAAGYVLSSVQIYLDNLDSTDVPQVSIYRADASGNPDSLLHTLTNPASISDDSLNTFTGNANLANGTNYLVVVEGTSGGFRVGAITSNGQDSGKANAWSIANQRVWRNSDSGAWSTNTTYKLRMNLTGTIVPAPTVTEVPSDWSLIPTGLTTGDQFRLIFLSSTKRDGSSTDIATYNTFIQTRAAAGHTDIQAYSDGFTVVGCTADVDARDNTGTTGVGVPIYWLNGNKVADDYADFYDEDWDEEAVNKNELGENGRNTNNSGNYPITGCDHDGTEYFSGTNRSLALGTDDVTGGRPNSTSSDHGPLSGAILDSTISRPMYGLSAVFEVAAVGANIDATGKPAITGTAEVGQTLTASKGTIVDTNGTTKADNGDSGYAYTYQWVRVSGGTETAISGATGTTYTPVADDVGETIKVQASFTDDADNAEGPLTSDATAAVVEACDALWCATITVGSSGTTVGFSDGDTGSFNAMGSLSPSQFRFEGKTVTVNTLVFYGDPGDMDFIYGVHSQHSGQLGLHARAG